MVGVSRGILILLEKRRRKKRPMSSARTIPGDLVAQNRRPRKPPQHLPSTLVTSAPQKPTTYRTVAMTTLLTPRLMMHGALAKRTKRRKVPSRRLRKSLSQRKKKRAGVVGVRPRPRPRRKMQLKKHLPQQRQTMMLLTGVSAGLKARRRT